MVEFPRRQRCQELYILFSCLRSRLVLGQNNCRSIHMYVNNRDETTVFKSFEDEDQLLWSNIVSDCMHCVLTEITLPWHYSNTHYGVCFIRPVWLISPYA